MATTRTYLDGKQADGLATAAPNYGKVNGTNMPVSGLYFDATTQENAFWQFPIVAYGSGNITVTVYWYADTASSGGVVWGCSIRAVTPNTDTQDVETDALATETNAADTHLGTTGQRAHTVDVVVSNLDSVANLDWVTLRLSRLTGNASDTMAGDAIVPFVLLAYSDT